MIKPTSILPRANAALLLLCVTATSFGCYHAGGDDGSPTVLSIVPVAEAADVPVNGRLTATFSEPMDPATINDTTFLRPRDPARFRSRAP